MRIWPAKDPAETLDFSWTIPLDTDDFVIEDGFAATLVSGTITINQESFTGALATFWAVGGAADELAQVSLVATTDAGRIFREVGILPIVERAAETLSQFRLSYPAFADIEDGKIGYWLAKAGAEVGTSWIEADRIPAKCAWAAHNLVATGALPSAVPAGLTSFRSGEFSATVSDAAAARTGYDATVYGREFIRLLRRSHAGARPAWTPPTSTDV